LYGGAGNYVQANFTTATPPVTCPGIYDVGANDNTAGAVTIPLNTDVYGLINVRNDNDYYTFSITTGGTITISLTTLPADYQLALLTVVVLYYYHQPITAPPAKRLMQPLHQASPIM
jgi:hypothetical protein